MARISQQGRRAIESVAWAWNSAFSRGSGYEYIGPGRVFEGQAVRGYYLDYAEKTRSPRAAAPERLSSIGMIQLALGWWERSLDAPGVAADSFVQTCELTLANADRAGRALLWPITVTVPKFGLRPPWHSALLQGQAASIFVRAYLLTGEVRWADAARRALGPLLEPTGELVTATAYGPIFEEAPSVPASHILNGWISALWGVRDVAVALDDRCARGVFDAGVRALCAYLPAYDIGWWTRYSLYPHPLEDLAKPIYQRLHADQIDVMHRVTGIPQFMDAAIRWRAYAHLGGSAAAVLQKAAFAAVDGQRRRRCPRPG